MTTSNKNDGAIDTSGFLSPVFGTERELMNAISSGAMPKRSFAGYIAGMNKEAAAPSGPLVKSALGVMVESNNRPAPSRLTGGGMSAPAVLPVEAPPRSVPDVTEIPAPEPATSETAPQTPEAPKTPPTAEFSTPAAKDVVKKSLAGVAALLNSMGVKPEGSKGELFSLSDDALHPVVLDVLFTGFFGPEWREWERDTLTGALMDIEAEGGGTMSEQNRTKLLAMSALHSTTYAWVSMNAFAKCALALDNRVPDFGVLEPVHPATILCALSVMRQVNPKGEFSHEVVRFMAASCVHDGVMIFPDREQGAGVGTVIQRLTNKSVSQIDIDMMMSLWERFRDAGGVDADHEHDAVDESHLVDFQVAQAARLAAYAEDFDARKSNQLSSLSAWTLQAHN